ncbi:MAG: CPBP family intramembrane metalloprotease [Chloroflexi bacterium]|nr:CPBP family intramembrane metalloprotease [Chloroflexota bacterium]MBU1748031.1 CPBP family intramembrane metalloprotease [Chloroflexota bacterium]
MGETTNHESPATGARAAFLTVPWGLGDVGRALIATLVIFGLALSISVVPLLVTHWLTPAVYPAVRAVLQEPLFQALILLPLEAAFIVPVWWWGVHKYGYSWRQMGLQPLADALPMLVTTFAMLAGFYMLNCCYAALLGLLLPGLEPLPVQLPIEGGWPVLTLTFLSLAVVAPLAEELLFRGFIFRGLCQRLSVGWAAVLSTVIFAIPHMDPTKLVPIFVLGLVLTYLYLRTGSLIPGILVHAAVNTASFVLLLLMQNAGVAAVGLWRFP